MDCVVRSWIFGTISTDLVNTVMVRGATARVMWLAIDTQSLYLHAEFCNFVQGDLSITDYCRHFKSMADALEDLGEHIPDRTLILNVLRSLNEKFFAIGLHPKRGRPFPTFLQARADLLLEDLTMAKSPSMPATALAVVARFT